MRAIDADAFADWVDRAVPADTPELLISKSMVMAGLKTKSVTPTVDVAKDTNVPDKWISVKRRLPEDETIVLAVVCYEVGWYRMLAWHDKHGWHSSADEFDERIDGDYVTLWLPIPELPKEKVGEQSD